MQHYEIKGNLFSAESLDNLTAKPGQNATDFGLASGTRLSDEIAHTFTMVRNQWTNFQYLCQRLDAKKTGVSETRNQWVVPMLDWLGYKLQYAGSKQIEGKTFAVSHQGQDGLPVHITSFRQALDYRNEYRRQSPHVVLQEYLNHTEHLYGFATNGLRLRLLRDHHRLTGIQYMEWDLERILEEGDLASFGLLYRLLHYSRLKGNENSLLENYHQDSVEEGYRVREKLQSAVKDCLLELGNGFLKHPNNEELRSAFLAEGAGQLTPVVFGEHLRQLVYRLLFLLVAEDRGVVFDPDSPHVSRTIYQQYYSLSRLRAMAETHSSIPSRYSDLWEQLKGTFSFFELPKVGQPIGITPLGGQLFHPDALGPLAGARLDNTSLLKALDRLCRFEQGHRSRMRINFARINVEEFGAVYESLLHLNPKIDLSNTRLPFSYAAGDTRKKTGAYYTHDDLVKQLLKTALQPVVKERLETAAQHHKTPALKQAAQEKALLDIKVCDPACGSGHFLLGAARALATELAYVRTPEGNSIDAAYPEALRDVISHCIYGVDINPDAIELCRMVLAMEGHVPGKPILFLEAKIKCGNSLVGWQGPFQIPEIPDAIFKAAPWEDKALAKTLKERNKQAREGQLRLPNILDNVSAKEYAQKVIHTNSLPSNSLEQVWAKSKSYRILKQAQQHLNKLFILNAGVYAFLQPLTSENDFPITRLELNQLIDSGFLDQNSLHTTIQSESKRERYFHWWLEFPDVFERAERKKGFDIILANPPWERLQIEEKQFFGSRIPVITNAKNAAERKKMIQELPPDNQHLAEFKQAKQDAHGNGKFARKSSFFGLTSSGKINTYSIFSELILNLLSGSGRAGFIVPTGIATDYTNRNFFQHLIEKNLLVSLFDFENRDGLFPDVHKSFRCSLITIDRKKKTADFQSELAFSLYNVGDISKQSKSFSIGENDFKLLNPKTKNCPTFRTNSDAILTKKIYQDCETLVGDSAWEIQFFTMFNMSTDSKSFQLKLDFFNLDNKPLPLYESKLFWHYNHRLNTYKNQENRNDGIIPFTEDNLTNPNQQVDAFYYLKKEIVKQRLELLEWNTDASWFLGFRSISSGTNERTFVSTVLPEAAFGNSIIILKNKFSALKQCAFVSNLSSLVFDYVCRQKISGTAVSNFMVKQLPIVGPEQFTQEDLFFIVPRVLELTYTAWDLKGFADKIWVAADASMCELLTQWRTQHGLRFDPNFDPQAELAPPNWALRREEEYPFPPYRWDSPSRHRLQSELDAFFAHKYQLTTEDLLYILDPHHPDSMGPDFPGETFRVLKTKELKKFSEFRTRRLVLDAWEKRPWEHPEAITTFSSVVSIDRPIRKPSKRLLQVMGHILYHHGRSPRHRHTLGRTKMEKLLHLAEAHLNLDLDRQPIKDQYGPADNYLREIATQQAKAQGFFEEIEHTGAVNQDGSQQTQYRYEKLEHFHSLHQEFKADLAKLFPEENILSQLNSLIQHFLPYSSRDTEIRVTLYAAWNNLLLAGTTIENDAQLIRAAREEWHPAKERYAVHLFQEGLDWLREVEVVPSGGGKVVG